MIQQLPTTKVIGATEVRNNFGALLNRVHRSREQLVVEKLGIPVAVIINMRDYEEYRRLLVQEYHRELGRQLGAAAKAQGITEEQLIADMEQDRQAIYDEMYSRQQ